MLWRGIEDVEESFEVPQGKIGRLIGKAQWHKSAKRMLSFPLSSEGGENIKKMEESSGARLRGRLLGDVVFCWRCELRESGCYACETHAEQHKCEAERLRFGATTKPRIRSSQRQMKGNSGSWSLVRRTKWRAPDR